MMSNTAASFIAKSTIKAADLEHRRKINFNIGKYNAVVPIGKKQFTNVMEAREMAKIKKWDAIEHLDQYLEMVEQKITERGARVLWAETAEEALEHIGKICIEKQCKTLVKSKSMVTEEIHLNDFLEKNGIESVETDLGEYIQQLDGEPPYHIVTPAMHKSKEDVARLFADKLGVPGGLSPEELTRVARQKLREVNEDFIPTLELGIAKFKEGEHRNKIQQNVQNCIEHGIPWDEELLIETFKGNWKWVRSIGEGEFLNGKCIRVYGSFQDINEKKLAQQKLLESNERFNIVAKATNDLIWDWDVITGNTIRLGTSFFENLGYKENFTKSDKSLWVNLIHPDTLTTKTKISQQLVKFVPSASRNNSIIDTHSLHTKRRPKIFCKYAIARILFRWKHIGDHKNLHYISLPREPDEHNPA